MTSKRVKYGLFFLAGILLVVLLLSAALYHVLKTPEGSLRLLKFLGSQAGVQMKIGRSEGNLMDGLALRNLELSTESFDARISSIFIKPSPRSLPAGFLSVEELRMEGVAVHDRRPEEKEPPDLSWPSVPGFLGSLRGGIASLDISNIEYRRLEEPPVRIDRIQGSLEWNAGILDLKNIRIESPWGELRGDASAGFIIPFLNLETALDLQSGGGDGVGKFSLKAGLRKTAAPEPIAGEVSLTAADIAGRKTGLTGIIGLAKHSVHLRDVRLLRPGLKGDMAGSAVVTFPEGEPFYSIRVKASHLDLSPEISFPTDISGEIDLKGVPADYTGSYSLTNTGKTWASTVLRGSFGGDLERLKLTLSEGKWLAGRVSGDVAVNWKEGVRLTAAVEGTGLNPAVFDSQWKGALNVTARGQLDMKADTPPDARVQAWISRSQLLGRDLTGEADVRLRGDDLDIALLDVRGRQFAVRASGALKERIDFRAVAGDLGELIPSARGRLSAQGWVRLRDGLTAFSAEGSGRNVSVDRFAAGSLSYRMTLAAEKDRLLDAAVNAKSLRYDSVELSAAVVRARGALSRHRISIEARAPRATADASLAGSYASGTWRGTIEKLSGRDRSGPWRLLSPAELMISRRAVSVSPLVLAGNAGERLDLAADMFLNPLQGRLNASWAGIRLERISSWIPDSGLSGKTSGNLETRFARGDVALLAGKFSSSGKAAIGGRPVSFNRAEALLNWGREGLDARLEVSLAGEGVINGRASSPAPVRLALPDQGKFEMDVRDLDPGLFHAWLPSGVTVAGRAAGKVEGRLLPGSAFELSGKLNVLSGSATRKDEEGQISIGFRSAAVDFSWRDADLRGRASAEFVDYGSLQAAFRIPLPARIPVVPDPSGTVAASIRGRIREAGMLNAAFPGFVEVGKGELDLAVTVGGAWGDPRVEGRVDMAKAGAYLPAAGIELKDVSLKARMEGTKILIDSLRANSGPGSIDLQAEIVLSGSQVSSYSGTVKGDRFQTVNLPELQLLTSPDLRFEGNLEKLAVRGSVSVPRMLALAGQGPSVITPSRDVVVVDAPPSRGRKMPFALDVRVAVILGDDVRVKADGANLQLGGTVATAATGPENIRAQGTVRIVDGSYSVYGVTLKVESGRIIFAGPADTPQLDITAARKVEDVTAGVFVGGTISSPRIRLYSRPAMQEPEILSYLVLGRALQGEGNEPDLSLLLRAAGSILTKSESPSVISQLKSRLGLEGVEVKFTRDTSAVAGQPGTAATQNGLMAGSMVSIGKYLTPRLYVSFGRYLFSEQSVVKLRYKFSEKWEVETHGGTVSGADIFYKIEFR